MVANLYLEIQWLGCLWFPCHFRCKIRENCHFGACQRLFWRYSSRASAFMRGSDPGLSWLLQRRADGAPALKKGVSIGFLAPKIWPVCFELAFVMPEQGQCALPFLRSRCSKNCRPGILKKAKGSCSLPFILTNGMI
jgi:hypothetical protein